MKNMIPTNIFKERQSILLKSLFLSLVLFCQTVIFGQNKSDVASISLDGDWEIIFDDLDEGVKNKWILSENFDKHEAVKKIQVPSCWEEIEKNYEGVGIYKTTFDIPENWEDRIIELNFEASNYKTEIWVNDQVVGFQEYQM